MQILSVNKEIDKSCDMRSATITIVQNCQRNDLIL